MSAPSRIATLDEASQAHKVEARFWSQVAFGQSPDDCWEWRGSGMPRGYGLFSISKPGHTAHKYLSHRVAWALERGGRMLPSETLLLHACDNPRCVNPHHLRPGTHTENMADMVHKGRKTGKGGGQGSRNGRAQLTEADVIRLRAGTLRASDLARDLGVTPSAATLARTGRTWAHLPMPGDPGWPAALARLGAESQAI